MIKRDIHSRKWAIYILLEYNFNLFSKHINVINVDAKAEYTMFS